MRKKPRWVKFVAKRGTVLRNCWREMFIAECRKGKLKTALVPFYNPPNIVEIREGDLYTRYGDRQITDDFSQKFYNKIIKNSSFSERFARQSILEAEKLVTLTRKISQNNLKKLSNKEILKRYKKYVQQHLKAYLFQQIFMDGSGVPEEKLKRWLGEKLNRSGRTNLLGRYSTLLTTSPKSIQQIEEEKSFLKLLLKIKLSSHLSSLFRLCPTDIKMQLPKIDPGLFDLITKHSHQYSYLFTKNLRSWNSIDMAGQWHRNDFLKKLSQKIKNVSPRKIKKRLQELERRPQKIIKAKEKLLSILNTTYQTKILIDFLTEMTWLNLYLRAIYEKAFILKENFFKELRNRLKLSLEEMSYVSHDEIVNFLSQRKAINKILLNKRKEKSLLVLEKNKLKIYTGQDVLKKQIQILGPLLIRDDLREIYGQVAFPGRAQGTVRVILDIQDLDKVQKGEILVVNRTDPMFIPALRKVKAIIADQGGVITHTAIVAREFKIPAIIGTEIGTQIFKNGEKVKIEATKGLVKRLSI